MGGRSRVASQLLAGQGFKEVYNLNGGIKAWHGLKAAGPAWVGMALISGDETPVEVITLAYGMEEGLRAFYTEMVSKVNDKEVSDMFARLADIEIRHKEKLFGLYKIFKPDVPHMEAFENLIIPEVMEGGLTIEEFLELNKPALRTIPDVLEMAMAIETQALDLYLRYSTKSEGEKTKKILYEVAEEEKGHLRHLGSLMDKRA